MEKMRVGRLVAKGQMVCEQVTIRPPDEGELLVKTLQASICGSDLHVIYDDVAMFDPPAPPGFPGHEAIGEVIESRSARFSTGDRVLTCPWPDVAGCFADYQTISAAFCLPLPRYDGPVEHLVMAQQLGTAIFAFQRINQDLRGKTVMVMGLGSAGSFFSYLAKRAGAEKVIASDLSSARLAAGARYGVDVAVDAANADVLDAVMDHTNARGADFLIEAVGRRDSLLQSVDLLREGGGMMFFGLPDTNQPVPFNFSTFFRKKLSAFSDYGAQHEPDLASFAQALQLVAQGDIDVSHMVSHLFPIEQIDEALHIAHHRSDNALKVSVSFP
jgi:L-iditol 2-dehydrogenase